MHPGSGRSATPGVHKGIVGWTSDDTAILFGMTTYAISEVEVLDEAAAQRYREPAAASLARHGGRYLARGAQPEVPEGHWPAQQRIVVLEFPSMEQLRNRYACADYAEALAVRETARTRRLLFVDGITGQ